MLHKPFHNLLTLCVQQNCELYDPSTDQWTLLPHCTIPHVATCMSYLPIDNYLYCFGGHSFKNDEDHSLLQSLNMDTSEWVVHPFSAKNILYFACCLLNVPKNYLVKYGYKGCS